MKKVISGICLVFLINCTGDTKQNRANFQILNALDFGNNPILFVQGIDNTLTPNCGVASPALTTNATVPGQTPAQTTPTTTTGTANQTRFSIISQLVLTNRETLSIRYVYDVTQTQGPVDAQQGFTLTGGAFNNTVTGNRGTIKWSNNGININTTLNTSQQIPFFELELNLTGTFTPGVTTSTTPLSCNTIDGINCTSAQSSTQCFTTDNRICLVTSTATGTSTVTITGTLKCNSPNVVAQ